MDNFNKEKLNVNRTITLFQIGSDRAEWVGFIDAVKEAGFKQSSDFWTNPGGDASGMFKAEVANSPKLAKLRKKYGITGFGFESQEAGTFIKESTYVIGEKVKVWMGGNKKALGEIKKIAFGDGFYFVEVAGQVVSRSLHELEPFIEGKDKVAKVTKKNMTLDEAVECALEEKEEVEEALDLVGKEDSDINNDGVIDDTDSYLKNRRDIIGREKDNMSVDEMVTEAMDMTETSDEYKFDEDGAPDFGLESEPQWSDEELEQYDIDQAEERRDRETDYFHSTQQDESLEGSKLNEYEGISGFIPVKDSRFILGIAYEEETEMLYVRFVSGVYEYHNVPLNVFEALEATSSKGKFFIDNIKNNPKYPYLLAKKYNKAYAKGVKPSWDKKAKKEDAGAGMVKRNENLVGAPLEEDHLSTRDEKVQFIIDNANYLPDSEWTLATRLIKNPDYGRELLAAKTDETIDALYYNIERTIDEEGDDYKVHKILRQNQGGGEFNMEEGMDIEPIKEAKSTKRFSILREDVDIITPLVESKGYKTINIFGELLESKKQGIINIVVEKNGRRATIVYNDNAQSKPWSWNGTQFNFIQEALDTVYVTTVQTLKEGQEIEFRERKDKAKAVNQLLEQRKFAAKTTELSKTEIQRREQRSQDILGKFMGDDLMNREFNR